MINSYISESMLYFWNFFLTFKSSNSWTSPSFTSHLAHCPQEFNHRRSPKGHEIIWQFLGLNQRKAKWSQILILKLQYFWSDLVWELRWLCQQCATSTASTNRFQLLIISDIQPSHEGNYNYLFRALRASHYFYKVECRTLCSGNRGS